MDFEKGMMPTQKQAQWQDMSLCYGPEPTSNALFYPPTPTLVYPQQPLYPYYDPNQYNLLFYPEVLPVTYEDTLDYSTASSQPVSRAPSQPEIHFPEGAPKSDGVRLGYPETTLFEPGVHIPRTKPTILSKDPSESKRCSICQQPFERDNSLRRHEMLHSGLKPFKCKPCNKEFTRQDIYRRHQQSTRCRKATERCQRFIFSYKS